VPMSLMFDDERMMIRDMARRLAEARLLPRH
jgi:hypothetical protein